MGCSLSDFTVGSWESVDVAGHRVAVAEAKTNYLKLAGVVWKVDGRFQGFTGSKEAALYFVRRDLEAEAAYQRGRW